MYSVVADTFKIYFHPVLIEPQLLIYGVFNLSKMIGVYKITNPVGEVYIGASTNIKRRISEHKYSRKIANLKNKVCLSIKKYGVENHLFEIVELCNKNELNDKERYWQEFYDSVYNGLNTQYTIVKTKPHFITDYHRSRLVNRRNAPDTLSAGKKKRKRNGTSDTKKLYVLDIENGIFYDTITELVPFTNYNYYVLNKMLRGFKKNITQYRLI